MARRGPVSYRDALTALGRSDPKVLNELDGVLGGLLLGTEVASSFGILAIPGLLGAKDEALSIARRLASKVSKVGRGIRTFDRTETITAAHSIITVDAFLTQLRATVGSTFLDELQLTDVEYRALLANQQRQMQQLKQDTRRRLEERFRAAQRDPSYTFVRSILDHPIPTPSAMLGYQANIETSIDPLFRQWASSFYVWLSGLSNFQRISRDLSRVEFVDLLATSSLRAYEENYRQLALDAPEFGIWAAQSETLWQSSILSDIHDRVRDLQKSLLALPQIYQASTGTAPASPILDLLLRIHSSFLDNPVFQDPAGHQTATVLIPPASIGHLTPEFRVVRAGEDAAVSDDTWWNHQTLRSDFNVFIACHLADPLCEELPLVVLGSPGGGKSTLLRLLSASLPNDRYAPIYLRLQSLPRTGSIHSRLSAGLEEVTTGRANWSSFSTEAQGVVRVLLLDGLDEVLRADKIQRTRLLEELAELQQRERALGSPLAIVVTCRTVVLHPDDIPVGAPVARLELFSESQIRSWLDIWAAHNSHLAEAAPERLLTFNEVRPHLELASHPLLLVLLALYQANSDGMPLATLAASRANLYGAVIERFLRREEERARKGSCPSGEREVWRVWLRHLTLIASAMHCEGTLHIGHTELTDQIAQQWPEEDPRLVLEVLDRFYFVHIMEGAGSGPAQSRAYEFLHATFGEYLTALRFMNLLEELSSESSRDAHATAQVELHVMLSSQPLARRDSVLEFLSDLASTWPEPALVASCGLLGHWMVNGGDAKLARPEDSAPRLGVAAANATLVVALLRGSVDLEELGVTGPDWLDGWRSNVWLWRAALDDTDYKAQIRRLEARRSEDGQSAEIHYLPAQTWSLEDEVDPEAQTFSLLLDRENLALLRIGQSRLRSHGLQTPGLGGTYLMLLIHLAEGAAGSQQELFQAYRDLARHATDPQSGGRNAVSSARKLLVDCVSRDQEVLVQNTETLRQLANVARWVRGLHELPRVRSLERPDGARLYLTQLYDLLDSSIQTQRSP